MTEHGVVSDTGLAQAVAVSDPPIGQTAPVMVTRDGQLVVRLADAGGLPEGTERFNERVEVIVNPAALVDQLLVAARPCRLLELFGYVNGTDPTMYSYVQLFNQNVALAGGAIPVLEFPVNQDHGVFSQGYEHFFSVGLVVGLSTTQGVYTADPRLFVAVKALVDGGPA